MYLCSPREGKPRLRRVLYAANAGDARAVLCRGGEALRLTYDHKGSDAQESKRIMDAGGFVMNNRVNGGLLSFSASN
jgi:protein phosphatase PTC1